MKIHNNQCFFFDKCFLFFGQNNWGKFGKFSLSSLNATNFANLWMKKKKKTLHGMKINIIIAITTIMCILS